MHHTPKLATKAASGRTQHTTACCPVCQGSAGRSSDRPAHRQRATQWQPVCQHIINPPNSLAGHTRRQSCWTGRSPINKTGSKEMYSRPTCSMRPVGQRKLNCNGSHLGHTQNRSSQVIQPTCRKNKRQGPTNVMETLCLHFVSVVGFSVT